jgi:hypothetical protein
MYYQSVAEYRIPSIIPPILGLYIFNFKSLHTIKVFYLVEREVDDV